MLPYDVCIIGAGVVGCAAARLLSRYDLKILLIERRDDVVGGATRGNSGIVHGGYAARHGSLKATLCRRGNRMYEGLNAELNYGYRECGSLVLALDHGQRAALAELAENGQKNGVDDLEILTGEQVRQLEPAVNPGAAAALYCPTAGVTSPYEMAIALAENAVANGVELVLGEEVVAIQAGEGFQIATPRTQYKARFVVNAAGAFSDRVAGMVGEPGFRIVPRLGQYLLLDRGTGDAIRQVLFQVPSGGSKGILVTGTYHGNLMLGPNAEEVNDPEEDRTTLEVLETILETALLSVPDIDTSRIITTYSGVRATSSTGDFVIGPGPVPGFINAAGIDSPGLTASPAIAEMVRDHLADAGLELHERPGYLPERRGIIVPKNLSDQEVTARLQLDGPEQIVCRCERVTRAEILDSLSRGIPVRSIAGVKYRTRAGMGRCQGTYCRKRVGALLEEQTGVSANQVISAYEQTLAAKQRIKAAVIKSQTA